MKATINAADLTDWLNTITPLVSECKLRCTEEGFKTTAVDPANVGMVDTELFPGSFESYQASGATLGINLDKLTETLGLADSDDLVELTLDQETRKLNIKIGGLQRTLALIDPDSIRQEPDIPDLDLPVNVRVNSDGISRGLTAAEMVSDHVRLAGTGDPGEEAALRIEAEGDTDDVTVALDEAVHEGDGIESGVAAAALFSLDYLSDMDGGIPKDVPVRLRLGSEVPVKLTFSAAPKSTTTYLLAPRISSD